MNICLYLLSFCFDFLSAQLNLCLLHLNEWVLGLLLSLLLLSFGVVELENLGRALRDQPGDLDFNILGELSIWGGQGHANLFLYLTAVLECQMFGNVRHCLCLHLLSHGVLSNLGGDGRILHKRSVSADVGFVILVDKRFGWLSVEECHVFADWILRGLIVFRRNQLVCVGDTQHLNHLAVELG